MFANDFQTHMNTLSVLSADAKVKGLLSTDGLMLHADSMGDEDMVGTLLSLLASVAGKVGQMNQLGGLTQIQITLAQGEINIIPLDNDILGFFVIPSDERNVLTTSNG
ncbi:roadblock/LC7 domain-containing protein [Acidithiobacillus sp.]|uniref:roadblock/LC7 domain-containing protein n=1 Tax=Acidithiobacillus sp. TaxID=1872118 RepID=UPI00231784E4|nr:roadblock/LC7 domain-containing protein [Acidithiobacillus sp.]MDA8246037.1 roadblock/LC7 domain-containing protein [Acidithiobacillus sp.]